MKIYILITVFLVTIIGCQDILELEPKGAPSSDIFWKTKEDVIAASNGLYILNDNQSIYGRGIHLYSLIPSDDFVVGKSKAQIERIKNFQNDGSGSYTRDIWPQHYIVIKRANDIIVAVQDVEIYTDLKNFILGQAYFMRGLAYFQLSVIYGDENAGIPIIDESTKSYYIPRTDHVSVNYDFAAADFTRAADLLPYFNELDEADYGKPHKNAALGYLARTHLHNAQYNNQDASWGKVVEACNLVINSGNNGLEGSFKDVFHIDNNWGKEYLWSVPSNVLGGSIFPGASLENKGWDKYNGWGYFAPTNELYDSYDPLDSRRAVTLLKFNDPFTYFGENRVYSSEINLTGIQFAKYLQPFEADGAINLNANGDHPTTNLNLPLMRYSHILLMKAEALIMQGLSADTEINLVRGRAGLGNLTGATLADLKKERRAEFAGEIFGRYEDLCRWNDVATAVTLQLNGRIHSDKTEPTSAFTLEEVWPARTFKSKVWPIPPAQIDASRGSLVQNSDW